MKMEQNRTRACRKTWTQGMATVSLFSCHLLIGCFFGQKFNNISSWGTGHHFMIKKFFLPNWYKFIWINSACVPFEDFGHCGDCILSRINMFRLSWIRSLDDFNQSGNGSCANRCKTRSTKLTHYSTTISCSLSDFRVGRCNIVKQLVDKVLLVVEGSRTGVLNQVIEYTQTPLVVWRRTISLLENKNTKNWTNVSFSLIKPR